MFIVRASLTFLLTMTPMFSHASDKQDDESSKIEVRTGLYQSEAFKLNAPNASEEPYRLYMRIFHGKKVALVLSPATGEDVSGQLVEGSDMAGNNSYSESDSGITFKLGPTQHTVTPIKTGFVKLRSVYSNGSVTERDLSIVDFE